MFIKANGINIFYEKSGKGQPLIMLHGNGENHKIFDKPVSILKEHFTVYTIDFRNHGESDRVNSYTYSDHVNDVYEFIKALDIENPLLYGFSDGGIVGLMIAIKHPTLLKKLIASGPNITPDGVKNTFVKVWKLMYSITNSPNLSLMLNEPNISTAELALIKTPTIITAGSHDIIKPGHLKLISNSIPQSTLTVFKHSSHSSYIVNNTKIAQFIIENK